MNSSTQTHRRYLRRIALSLLAALILAPAAQARPDPTTGGPVAEQPVAGQADDGFDWADAGIGAGAAAGIVVLAGTAAGAGLRRRSTGRGSGPRVSSREARVPALLGNPRPARAALPTIPRRRAQL
jgi:hypothetical protein